MQFLKLAAISAALLSTLALSSAQAIRVISAPDGGSNLTLTAMNNHGQVVGYYTVSGGPRGSGYRPFMWDGTIHDLAYPTNGAMPTGINDDGVIVGNIIDGDMNQRAARLTASTYTMLDDGSTEVDSGSGNAGAINNSGNFLYNEYSGRSYYKNIVTGAMTRVGAAFPGSFVSRINDLNQVAGASYLTVFVDLGSGNGIDLGALLPGNDIFGVYAVGPDGRVSGAARPDVRGATTINFLWDPITGMHSSVEDRYIWFNNIGGSVGDTVVDGRLIPLYRHNGIAEEINDLIGPGPVRCSEAVFVNDLGNMVLRLESSQLAYFDPSLVTNLDPTVTIQGAGTFSSDGNPHAATATVTGYASAALSPSPTITYQPGGSTAPVQPGTYQVTAFFPGAPHYNSATATATIVIESSTQSVTVNVQGGVFNYDGSAHPATTTVTDGSNQPVPVAAAITYSPGGSNPPVDAGTYQVNATFGGDSHYNPAAGTGTIIILPAGTTTGVTGGTFTYDGSAHGATASVTSGGLALPGAAPTITYTPGGPSAPSTPGTYQVQASYPGDGNHSSSSGSATIVISKANLVVSANSVTKLLNGPMPALSGSMTGMIPGDGLGVSFTTTAVNASPIGTYPITPLVSDPLGKLGYYNVTVTSGTLNVIFGSNSGILQPINADGTSVCKQGSTVPAKFKVYDANGVSIGTPGSVVSFNIVQIVNGTVTTTVNETVTSTTPDSQFRWDGSQWIFNISTKSLSANQTYYFQVVLADGSTVNFRFGLR